MEKAIGTYPVDWAEARKSARFAKVAHNEALCMVSGTDTPALLRFMASGDLLHLGELILPAGGIGPRHTEADAHEGDMVLYVINGPLTILVNDTEETFHVPAGESAFLPAGTRYQCINYTSGIIKAVFIVAPAL